MALSNPLWRAELSRERSTNTEEATMRASRMLQRQQARAETRRTERKLAPIVTTAVSRFGGGGEFHDTSGFYERDTSWQRTIGFTFEPWLDRGGNRA